MNIINSSAFMKRNDVAMKVHTNSSKLLNEFEGFEKAKKPAKLDTFKAIMVCLVPLDPISPRHF